MGRLIWPNFGKGITLPTKGGDSTFGKTGTYASNLLSQMGFVCENTAGGNLTGMDIKDIDFMELVKLSLFDEACNTGVFREMHVRSDGSLKFLAAGSYSGLSSCVTYYSIQTSTFKELPAKAMATGTRGRTVRIDGEFEDLLVDVNSHNSKGWISENNLSSQFSNYATVFFDDPRNGTIDAAYDSLTDSQSLIGFAKRLSWDGSDSSTSKTVVKRSNASSVLILVTGSDSDYAADIGTLSRKGDGTAGIVIPIPDAIKARSISISDILIVGRKVESVMGIPFSSSDASSGASAKILLGITVEQDSVYRLKAGEHYCLTKTAEGTNIQFINNARALDPAEFGSGCTVEIDRDCSYYAISQKLAGVSVLPTGGTDGYLVAQVLAILDVKGPCINIFDPDAGTALTVSDSLEYEEAALILDEPLPPVAVDGSNVSLKDLSDRHSPIVSTKQYDSEYEEAISGMSGAGTTLDGIVPMDENRARAATSAVQSYLGGSRGREGTITTYICDPTSRPIMGGWGYDSNSIVNDIKYSYSDSNSYTISVTVGRFLSGASIFPERFKTVAPPRTTHSESCTVTQDSGNNVNFKVKTRDGVVEAVNATPDIIRVGDIVECSINMG